MNWLLTKASTNSIPVQGVTEVFRHEVPLLLSPTVLFPGSKLSLTILEEREIRLLEEILSGDRMVGVVLAKI